MCFKHIFKYNQRKLTYLIGIDYR